MWPVKLQEGLREDRVQCSRGIVCLHSFKDNPMTSLRRILPIHGLEKQKCDSICELSISSSNLQVLDSGVEELGQGGGGVPDASLAVCHQDHLLGIVTAERDAVVAVAPDGATADHDVDLSGEVRSEFDLNTNQNARYSLAA